jgi:hypothetical protein
MGYILRQAPVIVETSFVIGRPTVRTEDAFVLRTIVPGAVRLLLIDHELWFRRHPSLSEEDVLTPAYVNQPWPTLS